MLFTYKMAGPAAKKRRKRPAAKPKKRAGVRPKKKAVKVAKPPLIAFNARGNNALPFRSCQKSAVPNFCDIPDQRMDNFLRMFNLDKKGIGLKKQCPWETNCDIISRILPAKCMRGWKITRYLGKGAYGQVFGARSSSKTGALKIQHYRNKSSLNKEIKSQKQFFKMGLSPEIHSYCTIDRGGHRISFLNMGRIDTTLEHWLEEKRPNEMLDLLVERLFQILDVMRKKGVTHGDFHAGNIGFVFKREGAPGKIQLLDHGWSSTKGAMTGIELVQLMRTLHNYYMPQAIKSNLSFLLRRCQKEAKRRYGLQISQSLDTLDRQHEALHNLYVDKLYYS